MRFGPFLVFAALWSVLVLIDVGAAGALPAGIGVAMASFVAVGTETLEEAGTITLIPYCMTGVARRTPSGWRFSLLHGSEDRAAATPAGRSA